MPTAALPPCQVWTDVFFSSSPLRINKDAHHYYIMGFITSILGGCVYPAFGILYGGAINGFSLTSDKEIRDASYRSGLWFFIMAILAAACIAIQNHSLIRASEGESRSVHRRPLQCVLTLFCLVCLSVSSALTAKVRSLSFRAILRSDVAWFDDEKNSVSLELQ